MMKSTVIWRRRSSHFSSNVQIAPCCPARATIVGIGAVLLLGTHPASPAKAQQQIFIGDLRVEMERIVDRPSAAVLNRPVFMDTANDGSGRMFFAEQTGRIRLLNSGVFSTFLDLVPETVSSGERGLLGLVFHPDFAESGSAGYHKLYTFHSTPIDAGAAVDFTGPGTVRHHNILTEWQVDANNPNVVDMNSRREVFREAHVDFIHNGGMLEFGPDGYLYGSIGTPTFGNADRLRAQDNSDIFGTIFRIDPLDPSLTPTSSDPASANGKYRVPADNPFMTDPTALDEIFAYGVRSPYRFSIDPVSDLLFLADVGEGKREEIDVVTAGDNLGWPYQEGTSAGPVTLPNPAPELTGPLAEYTHADGRAVIGGYVYRGSIEALQGKYIFGELSWGTGPIFSSHGRLFWMDPFDEAGELRDPAEVEIHELAKGVDSCADNLRSVGCTMDGQVMSLAIDDEGELYTIGLFGGAAVVYKIVDAYIVPDGDYNGDRIVDAADYTIWADTLGSTGDLRANGDNTGASRGVIDEADFDVWQAHFGETTLGSGSGVAVPEPVTAALAALALTLSLALRRRTRT